MIRALFLAALLTAGGSRAYAQAPPSRPQVGDTLACASKDPAKRLFVVVGAIEPFGAADTVANVTLTNEQAGAPIGGMAHVPIQLKALAASCPGKAPAARPLATDFAAERQQWLVGVRSQRAAMFTISVDQIDDLLRAGMAAEKAEGAAP